MKRRSVALILLAALGLSGCVATAVVAGATAGGAVIYDRRSFSTMNQDRRASEMAQTIISRDEALQGRSHISVVTFDHVMLLLGQAQTPQLRQRAFELIDGQISSVKKVYNQITISGPTSFLQQTNDTWLTTKIKSAMLAEKGLNSTQIKVVTESSVVYLMGLVSRDQGRLASGVARRVPGVKRVVEVFQYNG